MTHARTKDGFRFGPMQLILAVVASMPVTIIEEVFIMNMFCSANGQSDISWIETELVEFPCIFQTTEAAMTRQDKAKTRQDKTKATS